MLKGKNCIVTGVANKHSIAWAVAKVRFRYLLADRVVRALLLKKSIVTGVARHGKRRVLTLYCFVKMNVLSVMSKA